MLPTGRPARTIVTATALTLALAAPAAARPIIAESEVQATPGRQVIHARLVSGCGDAATDRLEVRIPEGVLGVLPQAVPGWSVEIETSPTEPYDLFGTRLEERVTAVTWTGQPTPTDQYLDFGLAAVFTEEGVVAFPMIQGCGAQDVEFTVIADEGEEPDPGSGAPQVTVVAPEPDVDLAALSASVDELRETVRGLRSELDEVPIPRLRDRIGELEGRVDDLAAGLEGRPRRSPTPAPDQG
jgi:uncharacterized protein YcnI